MRTWDALLRLRRPRSCRFATLLAFGLFTLGASSALPAVPYARADEGEAWGEGPVPPLSHQGRWLTDARGRVVLLHGFSDVAKSAPFYPAAFGFGEADAVSGARIVSRPCTPLLLLRSLPHADRVSVEVVPSSAARCAPPDREAAAGRRES